MSVSFSVYIYWCIGTGISGFTVWVLILYFLDEASYKKQNSWPSVSWPPIYSVLDFFDQISNKKIFPVDEHTVHVFGQVQKNDCQIAADVRDPDGDKHQRKHARTLCWYIITKINNWSFFLSHAGHGTVKI